MSLTTLGKVPIWDQFPAFEELQLRVFQTSLFSIEECYIDSPMLSQVRETDLGTSPESSQTHSEKSRLDLLNSQDNKLI